MGIVLFYLLVNILVGIITCLFGKKLYFPILMLNIFSAVLSFSLSMFELNWGMFFITVVVGLFMAMLSYYVYKIGVFLLGGLLGGCISLFVISFLPSFMSSYSWIVSIVLILIFGFFAVKWCDFFIIVSTSFHGAFLISTFLYFLILNLGRLHNFVYVDGAISTISNLNHYINNIFIDQHSMVLLGITIVISIFAIMYQCYYFVKDLCKK